MITKDAQSKMLESTLKNSKESPSIDANSERICLYGTLLYKEMAEEENKRLCRHQLSEHRPGCENGWKVKEKDPPPSKAREGMSFPTDSCFHHGKATVTVILFQRCKSQR